MEPSQKTYTIESFTELVRRDPDAAYDILKTLSREKKQELLVGMPREAYNEIIDRTILENLNTGIRDKVETP